jgi:ubiquinone/menaquinone biosynthesis C-methylase UbiE
VTGDDAFARHDFASHYAEHAASGAHDGSGHQALLLELLGDLDGKRVLDAGCGPGVNAAELLSRGALVTAFDASAEMVRLATERLGPSSGVRQASLEEPLSWLPDGSMDLVVLAMVVHHLEDRPGALAEVFRVLRPGGALVLTTAHPTADWLRQGGSYFTSELVEKTTSGGWTVTFWRQPLAAWCKEFTDTGFVIARLVEPEPGPGSTEPDLIGFRLTKP